MVHTEGTQEHPEGSRKRARTVDFLDEDTVTVTGQKYGLISCISPDHIEGQPKNSGKVALKLRGCFDNVQQAEYQLKKIMRADSSVHTYCVDMYKWLLIPPPEDAVENSVYGEEFLQKLFKGYRKSRAVAKAAFNTRKENVIKDGLDKHLEPDEVITKQDLKPEDFKVGDVMPDVHIPSDSDSE